MVDERIPVSVIIPNYNSGTFLSECLVSINAEAVPEEILIIDDCSSDGSDSVAASLAEQYPNVRLLRRATNGGAAEARRDGIKSARMDIVALVDADDMIERGAISDAYRLMLSEQADMCIWQLCTLKDRKVEVHGANPDYFPLSGEAAVLLTLGGWKIHPLGLSRKELFLKAYQDFSEPMANADELLSRIVIRNAIKITGSRKKYYYRSQSASTTLSLQQFTPRRLGVLKSYVWLVEFSSGIAGAPLQRIALDAIWEATQIWKNRKKLGSDEAQAVIRNSLPRILRASAAHRWLWRMPKYAAATAFLLIAAR